MPPFAMAKPIGCSMVLLFAERKLRAPLPEPAAVQTSVGDYLDNCVNPVELELRSTRTRCVA
jgi:hypothetical protein